MFSSSKRQKKQIIGDESFISSRYNLMNQQQAKFNLKLQYNDNINTKLAFNFNQIEQLLAQRKNLLLKKMEKIYEDKENRLQAISKGRLSDLKNQAKLLRDQHMAALIDNSENVASTKSLLKKIIEQHNFNQFQTMQKIKGKKYFDKLKQAQNELNNRSKRFSLLSEEQQKFNQKQRSLFQEIQNLQNQMIMILRRKQNDYVRRAEIVEQQIQRKKNILKENKLSKDKKKKQMETILSHIVETINHHQNYTLQRCADLQNLYGGTQNVDDFQKFIKQFQMIIENKLQDRKEKDDKKQKAVQQLIKISNGYERYIIQLRKQRQNEVILFENINQGFKNIIKTRLIEKIYLHEISHDRNNLIDILKKCKSYKGLLNEFEGQRLKLNKEVSKINHLKSYFVPRLKALSSQDIRKQELKRQLAPMIGQLNELQKFQRKYKEYQHNTNNYLLKKQAIERDMDQLAQKGNLTEYKIRLKQLDRFQKEFQMHKQSVSSNEYQRRESRLTSQAQGLHLKYADLINPIIIEDENMTCFAFLTKLSKRLSII